MIIQNDTVNIEENAFKYDDNLKITLEKSNK